MREFVDKLTSELTQQRVDLREDVKTLTFELTQVRAAAEVREEILRQEVQLRVVVMANAVNAQAKGIEGGCS
jgi:hypothetical protein